MASTTTQWILQLIDRVSKPMQAVTNASRRSEVAINSVDTAIGRLKRNALQVFSGFALWQGFKGVTKLGFDLETAKVKFEVLLGSQKKAVNMLEQIDKFANSTPFDNAALQRNAELLLNFGVAGDKVIPTLKMLGDVSAGDKEKLSRLTLAYAQMKSTGKLMGQDFLQMVGASFNPLNVIAEKTGKSVEFLKDQMSKGKISADDISKSFEIATSKGGRFHKMMEKVSKTGSGKLSTLLGTLRTKIAKFSERFLVPIVSKFISLGIFIVNHITPVILKVISVLRNLKNWFVENKISVALFVVALIALNAQAILGHINFALFTIRFKAFSVATKIATALQWLFNAALTANPIGVVIALIAVLTGVFIMAYKKVAWFRGGIDALWTMLKGLATAIKDLVIVRIKELISGITGIGKTLMHFFKGEWKKAWETGKQATKDLLGVESAKKAVGEFKNIGKDSVLAFNKGYNSVKKQTKKDGKSGDHSSLDPEFLMGLAGGGSTNFSFDEATNGGGVGGGTAAKGSIGGGGKNITQTLNITNHFKVDKDARASMEDLADILAGRINDKLRDGLIALQ